MIQKYSGMGLLIAAMALAPVTSFAGKGLSYTYAELGYLNIDGDGLEGDGFKAKLSFAAHEYVHIRASFSNASIDKVAGASVDEKVDEFTIGAGGNYPVMDNVDVVAGVVYVVQEYNGSAKDDPEGHIAELGVRAKPMKKFEVEAGYINQVLQGDSSDGFYVGAVFDLNKDFAVSFRADDSDDADETDYFLGLRLNF